MFIVRIVCEADKIAVQFLGISQELFGIFFRIRATPLLGDFFVDTNPAQEYRLAVDEDIRPAGFHGAKTDAISGAVGVA